MKIKKFGRTFTVKQWTGQKLTKYIGLDTETELIKFQGHIPRLVITCAYDGSENVYIVTNARIKEFLNIHSKHTFIFHNFAFDMCVLTKETDYIWWDKIEKGLILDTALLFKLVYIATKGYPLGKSSLDYAVKVLLKDVLPKDNDIRLTFDQYIRKDGSIAYADISKEHYVYALLDPIATYLIWDNLQKQIKDLPTSTNLAHTIHLMGDIALDDIEKRGIEVDLDYTNKLRSKFETEMKPHADILASFGWVRGIRGIKGNFNHIVDFLDLKLPKTTSGDYSAKAEDLLQYNNEPFVQAYLKYNEVEHQHAFLNKLTTNRVHPYYDSIKKTGRTGSRNPNIQNPPRVGGIRECFIPKEGHLFGNADYGAIEMYTMADILKRKYKTSKMYDVLQAGKDPHLYVASIIYNKCEDQITKDQRQAAKIANYGFLANMSETTFMAYALQFGTTFNYADAKRIKSGWTSAYPKIIKHWRDGFRYKSFVSTTGFVRAHCSYTEWLNTHFQGRAAEGAKIALYLGFKAGLKQNMFVHDEINIEAEKSEIEDQLKLLRELMVKGMQKVCDMNIKTSGEIRERHCK